MTEAIAPTPDLIDELCRLTPAERALRLDREDDPTGLVLGLADTVATLAAAEVGRAVEVATMTVELADRVGTADVRARARRARARALAYAGQFDDALATSLAAVDIATAAGLSVEAGRARLASMHALGELGRLDEAIAAGRAARVVFETAGEPAFAARAEINLGIIHQKRDEPHAALARFEDARPALAGEPLMLGHLDNSRGEALLAVNDFAGAESAFLLALDVFEATGAALTAAIVEGNLADLAARQGRLERALYFFEGARRHLDAENAPAVAARLLAEQAEAKTILGMPSAALSEYKTALAELDRLGLALEAARARCGMGLTLMRIDRPAEAATSLAAAAVAFDELGHASARARVDLARADLALAQGRPGDARRLALRALSVLDDRAADRAVARHVLARAALAAGDLETAWADLAAALSAARALDLAPLLADIHETRGQVAKRSGRLGAAVTEFTEAVDHVERVRGALQADRFRAAFLGQRHSVHAGLVDAHLTQNAPGAVIEAFAVAERAKCRSLLDKIQRGFDRNPSDLDATDDIASTLKATQRRLRSELNAYYSRLADEQPVAAADPATSWRTAIHERETKLEEVENRLAAMQPATGLFGKTVGVRDVQACLAADERLVEYYAIDDTLIAFVVSADRVEVARELTTVDALRGRLERLQFQIDRAQRPGPASPAREQRLLVDAQRELRSLFDTLLAPLLPNLAGAARLTIVPHGPGHRVPWNALWDGTRYLVEEVDVRVVPSASVFVHLRQSDAPPGAGRPLVVGVADAIAPEIETEARRVADLLDDARVLSGSMATTQAVMAAATDAPIIHLACHGRFLPEYPQGSGLKLADRWLTVQDTQDLRLRASLVTLSGCETGVHAVDAGDEMVGLLRSLLAAGARAIIVSRWRVGDRETLDLMTDVYKDAGHAAQRLRAAQLALMQRWPHPAHWAAFTLVGEP